MKNKIYLIIMIILILFLSIMNLNDYLYYYGSKIIIIPVIFLLLKYVYLQKYSKILLFSFVFLIIWAIIINLIFNTSKIYLAIMNLLILMIFILFLPKFNSNQKNNYILLYLIMSIFTVIVIKFYYSNYPINLSLGRDINYITYTGNINRDGMIFFLNSIIAYILYLKDRRKILIFISVFSLLLLIVVNSVTLYVITFLFLLTKIIMLRNIKRRILILFFLVIISSILIGNYEFNYLEILGGRDIAFLNAIDLIKKNIWGNGYFSWGTLVEYGNVAYINPHNIILLSLLLYGWIGSILYFNIILYYFRKIYKKLTSKQYNFNKNDFLLNLFCLNFVSLVSMLAYTSAYGLTDLRSYLEIIIFTISANYYEITEMKNEL